MTTQEVVLKLLSQSIYLSLFIFFSLPVSLYLSPSNTHTHTLIFFASSCGLSTVIFRNHGKTGFFLYIVHFQVINNFAKITEFKKSFQ